MSLHDVSLRYSRISFKHVEHGFNTSANMCFSQFKLIKHPSIHYFEQQCRSCKQWARNGDNVIGIFVEVNFQG